MTRWIVLILMTGFSACSSLTPLKNPFEDARDSHAPRENPAGTLRILAVDVGQGDSTLVIGPTGRTLMIDGGPPTAGIARVLPLLQSLAIDAIDVMIATHYDADHIGGLVEVLKGADQIAGTEDDVLPTEALWDRGKATTKETPIYRDYEEAAKDHRKTVAAGESITLGGGATADVVVVNGRFVDGRSIHLNPDEENEASIGTLIRYGNFSYFTVGDLTGGGSPGGYETKDMETIAGEIVGDIDVLHVGHHGSESSSNATFLEETHPEAAIISVGSDNDYRHPAQSTLQRLESIGATIYRTDQMGDLEIETDGHGYQITPL